jgi:hypothetical protein
MKELATLENLKTLGLVETKVTDKGLKALAALKTLRRLTLGRTAVTSDGVSELRKALPKCEILGLDF